MTSARQVAESIPAAHWRQVDPCPDECLCHLSERNELIQMISEVSIDSPPYYQHGVYVLECGKPRTDEAKQTAYRTLERGNIPRFIDAAKSADRLFYVGLSQRLLDRLWMILFNTQTDFLQIYPPVRLLRVDWHATLAASRRAKNEVAEALEKRFPKSYVYSYQV